ncbi:hypothetical protein A2U01_0109418, partial [Trifolium medium]|nr:hypothetical protein [Trifolium medium]
VLFHRDPPYLKLVTNVTASSFTIEIISF